MRGERDRSNREVIIEGERERINPEMENSNEVCKYS